MNITKQDQLIKLESENTGLSPTKNIQFDKDGYIILRNIWDPKKLYHPVPEERGQIKYFGSIDKFYHVPEESQVNGSISRYSHPMYKQIHSEIRMKLEKEIGKKLYNTYYYDRFYFPKQKLVKHLDRDACEISITVHIGTNLKKPWPIWIKTPDTYSEDKKQIISAGKERSIILNPGDGMVYKGCERPHWRNPMPIEYKRNWYGKKIEKENLYYHQVFFHYVLQDGQRAHYAWDRSG